jgi:hypothetical protein
MKRLLLVLLALGAVSVGVLLAVASRSPRGAPPGIEYGEHLLRQKAEPRAPESEAPGSAMRDFYFDQAPRGAAEGDGEQGGEARVGRRGRPAAVPDPGTEKLMEYPALDGTLEAEEGSKLRKNGLDAIGQVTDREQQARAQALRQAMQGLEQKERSDEDHPGEFEAGLKRGGKGRSLVVGDSGRGLGGLPAKAMDALEDIDENEPEDLAQDDLQDGRAQEDLPVRKRKVVRLGERSRVEKPEEVTIETLKVGYLSERSELSELSNLLARSELADIKDKNVQDAQNRPALVDLGTLELEGQAVTPAEDRPEQFLPRMCYFENTYLGGNAAYQERLRRLEADLSGSPHLLAALEPQPFDAPEDAGLRLTATLDHTHLDRPGRVMLQVGLQGSRRFGWRRPPLDIVLLVDAGLNDTLVPAADALLKRLGPQDRLAIVQAGESEPVVGLADRRTVRTALARYTEPAGGRADDVLLDHALAAAGRLLTGADDQARVPGTRTLVLVTGSGREERIRRTRVQVQALAEQGVVTSVVAMSTAHDAGWWQVASAGNGNLHRAQGTGGLGEVMEAELASLARVIARLLRVNIRLAPGTEGVRILGSRVLGQEEVREVKAREVATDRNLSRALGVKADRGEDDDGIQTVIPYFYGGDSHVILVELWVEKPGAVAEISLKYKDMVNLENATAQASVALSARPRVGALAQTQVLRNLHGFDFAAALKEAATLASVGDREAAQQLLRARAQTDADRRLGEAFVALMQRSPRADLVSAALALAAERRIGASQ